MMKLMISVESIFWLQKKEDLLKELYRTSNADLVYTLSFDYYNYDNVSFIEKYKPNLLKNTSSCITNRYIRNVYDRTFKNEALIILC